MVDHLFSSTLLLTSLPYIPSRGQGQNSEQLSALKFDNLAPHQKPPAMTELQPSS